MQNMQSVHFLVSVKHQNRIIVSLIMWYRNQGKMCLLYFLPYILQKESKDRTSLSQVSFRIAAVKNFAKFTKNICNEVLSNTLAKKWFLCWYFLVKFSKLFRKALLQNMSGQLSEVAVPMYSTKKAFLKNSQNSQESTCVGVSL